MSTALMPQDPTRFGSDQRVTLGRVISSEWIKFRSARSTMITMGVAVALVVGFGLLLSNVWTGEAPGSGRSGGGSSDPTSISLSGVSLAALTVAVLGVLTTAGEYTTGAIRATLSAVPARLPVLWAKVAVFATVTFGCMLVAVMVAFLGGQAILSANGHASVALSDAGVLRAVVGAAVYLTGAGLIGLALGVLLRGVASAVGLVVAAMFVAPGLTQLLPERWSDAISPYLPSNAGGSLMTVDPSGADLSAWAGLAVYGGYIVALLAAAAVLLEVRDA